LSAQAMSEFIAKQLTTPHRLKHWSFRFGLQCGIAMIALGLLKKRGNFFVSGLKVICSGKWKKTRSGRKQKVVFSIGRLRTQSMNSVSSYGFTVLATKFGAFSVKVWISYLPFFCLKSRVSKKVLSFFSSEKAGQIRRDQTPDSPKSWAGMKRF
jgi:ribosomal protein S3